MAIGRPRAFDVDKALDRALNVFWRKGYEGASVSDLTDAMGINPPSLYAAFGNKEGLFRRALDRYVEVRSLAWSEAFEQTTSRAVVETLFLRTIDLLSDKMNPQGCLLVQGAHACGEASDPIRKELCARRSAGLTALRERLDRAKAEGDLPPDAEPADLARYVATVLEGLSIQAAAGAGRDQLERVTNTAMRAWP